MNTDRDLVQNKSSGKKGNPLTKSLALPSGSCDKQSTGSAIGVGGIKLDFRKSSSGGGLMKMLKGSGGGGSSNNKISNEVRRSQEAGAAAAKNASGNGKMGALYSAIELAKQNSYARVAPQARY